MRAGRQGTGDLPGPPVATTCLARLSERLVTPRDPDGIAIAPAPQHRVVLWLLIDPASRAPDSCELRDCRAGSPQRSPVQQPLRPIRRPVAGMLGDRPAITPGQPASQRTDVLPAPAAGPEQAQQLRALRRGQAGDRQCAVRQHETARPAAGRAQAAGSHFREPLCSPLQASRGSIRQHLTSSE